MSRETGRARGGITHWAGNTEGDLTPGQGEGRMLGFLCHRHLQSGAQSTVSFEVRYSEIKHMQSTVAMKIVLRSTSPQGENTQLKEKEV